MNSNPQPTAIDTRREAVRIAVTVSLITATIAGIAAFLGAVWFMSRTDPTAIDAVALNRDTSAMRLPGGDVMRVEVQEYEWSRGMPSVRMIQKDEGFCFLTGINGAFAGMAEDVSVRIEPDGYWYLKGRTNQPLVARAVSVRFAKKISADVLRLAEASPKLTWAQVLAELGKSNLPEARQLVAKEQAGVPADAAAQVALADAWQALADKEQTPHKTQIENRVAELYEAAIPNLPEADMADARRTLEQRRCVYLTRRLNDLAEWTRQSGHWIVTPDGKIRGQGDSVLTFNHSLPRDFVIQFHMNVLEGLRPRIHFDGTDLYVGNEGYARQIHAHGAATLQGAPAAYRNNQDLMVTVKFQEKAFELYVNEHLVASGTRKHTPDKTAFKICGGDWWSPGATAFWNFQVLPVQ